MGDNEHVQVSPARYQILVVDDHPIVRQGLRRLIDEEDDLAVCAEVDSSEGAKAAIRDLRPDIVIVDISLKHGDGIELVQHARAQDAALKILVLSMHDEMMYAERLLAAGANGYIMKEAASEQLLLALRRVLEGGVYVSEAIGSRMIQTMAAGGTHVSPNPIDRLSTREVQILHMIGKGLATRQVAEVLSLSVKTVESHRERIKRKLNLASGSQLVQYAVSWFGAA
jgi:DNA-binding NarL/FixJ family response regulator